MKLSRFKPVSGIYKICNSMNGKIYIGQARNTLLRWATHVDDLFSKRHANKHLLEDFQKYGVNAFTIDLIEKCNPDKNALLSRERYWITKYYQQGHQLYNKNIEGFWYVKNNGKNYSEIIAQNNEIRQRSKGSPR